MADLDLRSPGDLGARATGPEHGDGRGAGSWVGAVPFDDAFRVHAGAVRGLANRVQGNPAEAEDVAQEVFLRLWEGPDRFDPERGSLRSYLLALSFCRSVDRLRSNGARARREAREALPGHGVEPGFEHRVCDAEMISLLRRGLASLPPAEREAIVLAFYGGHTYREVAVLLAVPEGTAKGRIRSGLRRLGADLRAAGFSGPTPKPGPTELTPGGSESRP